MISGGDAGLSAASPRRFWARVCVAAWSVGFVSSFVGGCHDVVDEDDRRRPAHPSVATPAATSSVDAVDAAARAGENVEHTCGRIAPMEPKLLSQCIHELTAMQGTDPRKFEALSSCCDAAKAPRDMVGCLTKYLPMPFPEQR